MIITFARVLAVALLFIFFLPAQAGLRRAPPPNVVQEIFVPNQRQGEFVYFELESTPGKTSPQARKAMKALKSLVAKYFHVPESDSDDMEEHAKCIVQIHQITRRDVPAYRLSCRYDPKRGARVYVKIGEASTPEEVLEFNKEFAKENQELMKLFLPRRLPRLKSTPTPTV